MLAYIYILITLFVFVYLTTKCVFTYTDLEKNEEIRVDGNTKIAIALLIAVLWLPIFIISLFKTLFLNGEEK